MLGRVDHVAYVARDLAEGIGAFERTFGLEINAEFEFPEFSLRAVFMGADSFRVEVIEFRLPEIAERRLRGQPVALDHLAYEVADIESMAAHLASAGVRFCGPDGREVVEPLDLLGARHLWTIPGSVPGVSLQLIERPLAPVGDELEETPARLADPQLAGFGASRR